MVGTLFISLPQTTQGISTRASILLLAILFNGYLQLAELGNTLAGRPIVRRQRKFGLYSPTALALARTISDLPLIACQVIIFATITYALAGLQRSWTRFSIYLGFGERAVTVRNAIVSRIVNSVRYGAQSDRRIPHVCCDKSL